MDFKKFAQKGLMIALGNLFIGPALASPFDGFSIGLSGGVNDFNAKTHLQTATPTSALLLLPPPLPTIVTDIFNHRATVTSDNGIGELRVGYGKALCNSCFYIGGELFGNYSHPEVESSNFYSQEPLAIGINRRTNEHAQIKLNSFEYGIDFKPGYLLSAKTLIFARIGAAFNQIKLSDTSELFFPNDDFDSVTHTYKDENKTGFLLGLGLEHYLCQGLSVNLDYTYTCYGNASLDRVSDVTIIARPTGFVDVADGITQHIDARSHSNKVMLGVNYHFQPLCGPHVYDCGTYSCQVFTGLYAGVSLGDLHSRAHVRGQSAFVIVAADSVPILTDTVKNNADFGLNSFIGQLALGYGKQFCRFYLGAEGFINQANRHGTSNKDYTNGLIAGPAEPNDPDSLLLPTHFVTSSKYRLCNTEYGIDLTPGFLLSPSTLAIVRVGAVLNHHDLHEFNHYDNTPNIGVLVGNNLDGVGHKHETGLRLGLGVRQNLCNGWSLTADYVYTDYGRQHLDLITESFAFAGSEIVTIPEGFSDHSSVHISSQAVLVGLNYRFCL